MYCPSILSPLFIVNDSLNALLSRYLQTGTFISLHLDYEKYAHRGKDISQAKVLRRRRFTVQK